MNSVIEILKFIKSHEGCDSQDMDYHTVLDLYDSGYVSGRNISTLSCLSFKNLRLTISGSEYLELLKNPETEQNRAVKPAANIVNNWHNKPIGKIFIGVSIIVLAGAIFFIMYHNFGIRLG